MPEGADLGAEVVGNPHAARLRAFALGFPQVHEDLPWGHPAIKVRGKTFLFLAGETPETGFTFSVKLPVSGEMALTLPFTAPTGYGLGKSGWVTATFGPDDAPPMDMLEEWVDQSYRAVAPKRLAASVPPRRRIEGASPHS